MTKTQIKLFQSLSRQKYRKEYNAYLVEGDKNAKEWLLSDCSIKYIAVSAAWHAQNQDLISKHPEAELLPAELFELEKITTLQNPQQVILIVEKKIMSPTITSGASNWSLFLEKIQDPGNMGTIIRTADWFGIHEIFCSPDCVEIYNPKVVQASMGSLLRVNLQELSVDQLLRGNEKTVYAASLSGSALGNFTPPAPGIIAMGNESQGLSETLLSAADYKVTIPRTGHAESLNVAVAAGIICYAFCNK